MDSMRRDLQRRPDAAGVGTLIVKGVVHLATKHYIVSSMWIAGLIVLAFFQGFVVPEGRVDEYHQVMKGIDTRRIQAATGVVYSAEEHYRETKGWFWSCDATCQVHKKKWEAAKAELRALEKDAEDTQRKANSILGITSTYGVEEAKGLFWRSFGAGKRFGQRQTLWDLFFVGLRSMRRDESLFEYILQMVLHFLVNMSLGLVSALVGFLFSLWGFIRSYQPDFLTGLMFFGVAAVSAAAMVATYLVLLYGSVVGSVVVVTQAVVNNRLADDENRHRRQHLRQD